jgi:Transmembrane domain of unknown function (DUF3566)
VGTEEDGVDEAGRAPEPPVIVAPLGLDMDPEVKVPDAVTENESMSSAWEEDAETPGKRDDATASNGATTHHNGATGEQGRRVPFPADEIGKKKSPAPSAASPAGSDAAANGSAAEPRDGDGHSGGPSAPASGVFDSGRQAVRQAMTATTNWFSNPSAKSDTSAEDDTPATGSSRPAPPAAPSSLMAPPPPSTASPGSRGPGSSVFSPADRRPTFTATSDTETPSTTAPAPAAPSAAPSAPSGQTGPGGASSLWRDVRPSSPGPSSFAPASSGGTAAPGTRPSGPGTATRPPGPGAGAPDGQSFTAAGAASAVSGAAAGLATSVASAFQGRNSGGKRKRHATVRRSSKRQAQLTLSRVEPWSVMKFSFVVSVVAFIILFVAVAVLYMVLSALGVFTSLQHTVSSITSSQASAGTDISNWFSASRILGYTGMLGALNIVLITAISTIGAVIYNLIASTIGGVEVTLRETDLPQPGRLPSAVRVMAGMR